MWAIRLILSSILICVVCFSGELNAQTKSALLSLNNYGLFLIEKEMIRLIGDKDKKELTTKTKETYRSLFLLEDYFLNNGFQERTMKIVHEIVKMRDVTKDLKKKAFLECEAWRVLDHGLKNHENKELIGKLKKRRKYSRMDHIRFRQFMSDKVSSCIKYIGKDWVWVGPSYKDASFDLRAKNAVKSVQSYILFEHIGKKKETSN